MSFAIGAEFSFLESEKTNPIIVITHENQWVDSQIKLFTENCFQNTPRVSWCCFINNFHNQFLSLTKQNKTRPDRALSLYDAVLIFIFLFLCFLFVFVRS
jgi:hypothetical protein